MSEEHSRITASVAPARSAIDPYGIAKYFLNKTAFLCADGDYYVILDLRQDSYLSIERRRFEHLASLLSGWSGATSDVGIDSDCTAESACAANALIKRGILLVDSLGSKPARPVNAIAPERSVFDPVPDGGQHIPFQTGLRFLRSALSAHIQLRLRPIETVVHNVDARRIERRTPPTDHYVQRAAELTSSFTRLRPYFPRGYSCLFDSLALIDFLQLHGLFASWVFGVRSVPFAAHCWVQLGPVVLNDSLATVRKYTPIMLV